MVIGRIAFQFVHTGLTAGPIASFSVIFRVGFPFEATHRLRLCRNTCLSCYKLAKCRGFLRTPRSLWMRAAGAAQEGGKHLEMTRTIILFVDAKGAKQQK
jgi:hypothetical protein